MITNTIIEQQIELEGKLCVIHNCHSSIGFLTGKVEKHYMHNMNIKNNKNTTLYSLYEIFVIINKQHNLLLLPMSDFKMLD